MTDRQRTQLVKDISRMERELRAKRERLAMSQEGKTNRDKPDAPNGAALLEKRRKALRRLIESIGALSKGGNSVEDIRQERDRCR